MSAEESEQTHERGARWRRLAARLRLERLRGLVKQRRLRALIAPLALICAALVLQAVASLNPSFVERVYSLGLYPRIAVALSYTNRFFSFSVAEALLVVLVAAFVAWAGWQARRLYLRRVRAVELLFSTLVRALWLLGVGMMLFLLVWGLNYLRPPLAERMQLARRPPRLDELETISRTIVENINRSYTESAAGELSRAEGEPTRLPLSRAQLVAEIEAAYRGALPGVGGDARFGAPKPVYFSGVMSRLQISGVYSPFTGEANFNAIIPDNELPFTIAHEMAHQRGFAREDEANFVAFLVCTGSAHPYVRYSGYLNALGVLSIFSRAAPERARAVSAMLGAGARADLKANSLFWLRYSGRLGLLTRRLNHAYLKVNRIKSGVRNYDEAARLIIGYYLSQPQPPPPQPQP